MGGAPPKNPTKNPNQKEQHIKTQTFRLNRPQI